MQKTKTLYALLIGINEYSNPKNNLGGCVSDVQYLNEYLQTHFNNDTCLYKAKIVLNQEATRKNIIEGFAHFNQAQDGDICLFHFSGHGSQCPSPKEFSHLDPDEKHETIVCHDSRMSNGRDLIDKELSYLIWKATKDKSIKFLVIMDCCHSGSNTRDTHQIRRFGEPVKQQIPVENYLGFKDYTLNKDGKYTPPKGRHVLLSAARQEETAKEVYVQGEPRGIFTYCLLDALKKSHHQISYTELVNRIRLRIRNKVKDQSPQLEASLPEDQDLFFLSDKDKKQAPAYFVAYDKSKRTWALNAGALHGILPDTTSSKTILEIESSDHFFSIDQVLPNQTLVKGMHQFDTNKVYKARIKTQGFPLLKIAFYTENNLSGETFIKEAIANYPSNTFDIVDHPTDAQYLIHAKQDCYFLTKMDEVIENKKDGKSIPLNLIHPVFKKIKGFGLETANEFLQCLEKIIQWTRLLELTNTNTTIKNTEIEITLSQTLASKNTNTLPTIHLIDWQNPATFKYQLLDQEWHQPAFQLNIKNTSHRELWFSLVYFSSDFGITNVLIPKQQLQVGQSVAASYTINGHTQFTIPIQIEEHYLEKGITSIQEHLKLFICTEEFDTNNFNQQGVPFDHSYKSTPPKVPTQILHPPDWTTKEISLKIVRPMESKGRV